MSILIKKNIQKGGEVSNTNKAKIKNLIGSGESRLVFCDLRIPIYTLGVSNFIQGIPIIIVKKKNIINHPSNYYAIEKKPDNNFEILAQALGKERFYDDLNSIKQLKSNKSALVTKILIFFKLNWNINDPHFCQEFYDLNRYFMSRIP